MIVYGVNPVLEALRSDSKPERILVCRGRRGGRIEAIVQEAKRLRVPLRFEPAQSLERQAGTKQHQDVLAVLSSVVWSDLESILASNPRLLLVVDNLEDPRNLGAVLRTAEAAGVEGVLLPERRCCGVTPTVVKASAGAALHLRLAHIGNVAQTLERLKGAGLWIAGLDAAGKDRIEGLDTSGPLALVVGGESRGLRRLVREHCDYLVALPMAGRVESLNLSVAVGVLLYQIVFSRRRSSPGS